MKNYLIGIFVFLALEAFLIALSIYLEIYTQATTGDMTRIETGLPLIVAILLALISVCEGCCLGPRMMKILDTHRNDIPQQLLSETNGRNGASELGDVLPPHS
jgi:hypothetical protein